MLVFGPTLKTALCHIRTWVGRRINTTRSLQSSYEVGILRYRGCIHLTATSSGKFTFFFFYKSPCYKAESHFLWYIHSPFFFSLICTKGSARPFGCAALKARFSLYLPLRYLHSAKITPLLAAAPGLSYRTALARKALAIVRYARTVLARKALATVPYVRIALARKALATVSIRPHSFVAKQP